LTTAKDPRPWVNPLAVAIVRWRRMGTPPIESNPCRQLSDTATRRSLRGTCKRSYDKVLKRFGAPNVEFDLFQGVEALLFVQLADDAKP